jgi:hypothetical protein
MTFEGDPITNAVYGGIKRDIQVMLEAKRLRGALLLIYSGMDTMAWIGMDASKEDVDRSDFVTWAEKYIRFDGAEQLTGLDLYGARCALLHNYAIYSKLSREKKCRAVGYTDKMSPPVRYNPTKSTEIVMVSLHHLAEAFFAGLDRFLVDIFADSARRPTAEARLAKLIQELPYEPPKRRREP